MVLLKAPSVNVLFLGSKNSILVQFIESLGDSVFVMEDKFNPDLLENHNIGFVVSYGYRHIIRQDVLDKIADKIINLHISFLPWNRGADPNFWSFIDNTPKGVTIHYIDAGIDTGDIIVQREVLLSESETLSSSYQKLKQKIEELFMEHWPKIRIGTCGRIKQSSNGTFHKTIDKEPLQHLLEKGWETPIAALVNIKTEDRENLKKIF